MAFTALDRLHPGGALGAAVSGGGDSLALLLLCADWARARGVRFEAATVDHRLRPAAAAEAAGVALRAAALGVPHALLVWDDAPGRGNLQAAARDARAALLADWAAARGLAAIATGHTLDDQAETVLMRLARGAGVDGLAGVPARARRAGALWLRPLLGLRRDALRDWLAARGERWVEDPANADPRFERARTRRLLAALAPLGLTADSLAATAAAMARARPALEAAADALAAAAAALGPLGEVRIDRSRWLAAAEDPALRLLARALALASGAARAPRAEALLRLRAAVAASPAGRRTLGGAVLGWRGPTLTVAREPAAAAATLTAPVDGAIWDGRWRVAADGPGAVAMLGEAGAAALRAAAREGRWRAPAGWRAAPRAARLASPALWRDGTLAAAPAAAYGDGLTATPVARL